MLAALKTSSLSPPLPVVTIKTNQFVPWLAVTCISGAVCTERNCIENLTTVLNCSATRGYLQLLKEKLKSHFHFHL